MSRGGVPEGGAVVLDVAQLEALLARTFSIGLDVGRGREKAALVRLRLSKALLGAAETQAMAAEALAQARHHRSPARQIRLGGWHRVRAPRPARNGLRGLRGQEMSLRDFAARLVISTGKKKGQHPSPATVMRMLREHDEKAAAAVAVG